MYVCTVLCLVTQLCLTLCDPMNCSPPGFSAHGDSQARILEWITIPSSRGSFQPWTEPRSLLCMCSLPSEPSQKPKSTRVGSLSLLQGIFPTQRLNKDLRTAGGFFTN